MLQDDGREKPRLPVKVIRIGERDCPVRAGEDTAKISLYLNWRDRKEVFPRLLEKRDRARAGGIARIDLGGSTWEVMPRGFGGDGGMPHLGLKLFRADAPDIVLALRDADYNERCINGMLDLGSLVLMCKGGLAAVWLEMIGFFSELGAEVAGNVLSRIDIAADIGGFPVSPFVEKLKAGQVIGGGREDGVYMESEYRSNRVPTGLICGGKSGLLRFRAYDKLRNPDKDEATRFAKQAILREILGEQDAVTRLEFEIRRAQIRHWNKFNRLGGAQINGVEDWHRHRGRVLDHLMSEWLRFTEKCPDRENNHHDRAEDWSVWALAKEAALAILREDDALELARPVAPARDGSHLLDQALGCSVTYIAKYQPPMTDYQSVDGCISAFSAHVRGHRKRCRNKYRDLRERDKGMTES